MINTVFLSEKKIIHTQNSLHYESPGRILTFFLLGLTYLLGLITHNYLLLFILFNCCANKEEPFDIISLIFPGTWVIKVKNKSPPLPYLHLSSSLYPLRASWHIRLWCTVYTCLCFWLLSLLMPRYSSPSNTPPARGCCWSAYFSPSSWVSCHSGGTYPGVLHPFM